MRLEPVGLVENLDDLDLEPIIIPVVGYTRAKEAVTFDVEFRASQPLGMAFDVMRQTTVNDDGSTAIPMDLAMRFLDACVIDSCREPWAEFLNRDDVYVQQETITALYQLLMETYAGGKDQTRPTSQRLASSRGGRTTTPTSRGAARSKASTSGRSR